MIVTEGPTGGIQNGTSDSTGRFRTAPHGSTDRVSLADGFTLIELLIVLTLISTLAGMAMAQYRHSLDHARESVLAKDLAVMRDALDRYYADKGQFPATLDALATEHYVRAIPDDPFTKSAATWQTVPAEPDAANPTAEPGVFDIHSGSDRVSLDGRRYADW